MTNDYSIYVNIYKFIKYRYDIDPVQPLLTMKEFTKTYTSNKYIDIKVGDVAVIILTLDNSDYSSINAATKKLLMKYIKSTPTPKEIMLVSNFNFIVVNNGVIADLVAAKKLISDLTSGNDNTNPSIWLQIRPKSVFYTDIPSITWLPVHRRVDHQTFVQTTSRWIDIKTLPRIDEFDPYVTWIGGKVGDIIEVDRYTPSVGKQSIYRLVK